MYLAEIWRKAGKIAGAVASAMNADGYNVLCNNGRAAGQLVEHVHFHIIPRMTGDGVFTRGLLRNIRKARLKTAEQISEKIEDGI